MQKNPTAMFCKIFSIFLLIQLVRVEARIPFFSNPEEPIDKLLQERKEKLDYRLPSYIVPKNYTITLTPYFDEPSIKNFTFDGSIEITITIEKETPNITLHARELKFEFRDVVLKKDDHTELANEEIQTYTKWDAQRDFVHIIKSDNKNFAQGNYVLKINKFTGILNNEMRGFYRSSYKNEKAERVWLATTHFEPVGARRAIPCFDEPHFKATFNLTIIHPVNYNAISNMPVAVSSNIENKLVKTVFDTTPPMSTYLLAFVVSDFKSVGNPNFKVYAKPTAYEHGKLAVETGKKLLKALETYTGVKFTLPKMDQIAIPDFAAGAMENWGLVTYREKSLLYDNKTSTTGEMQGIVETIAHEFAHQWFGDLVSPKWWKYLWLNEGFANFFQSIITEQVEPKWQSVHQSVVKTVQGAAFDFDSTAKTHPINQQVESPAEISAIFDTISYQKGGAVIRMMQHFLGNDVFKRGLNIYLTENSLKSADSGDLFRALDKAAKEAKLNLDYKMEVIMDSWVNHKGYPVVTVTRNSRELKIEQKRFFSYNATEENEEKYYWHIPINYATTKNQNFNNTSVQLWLNEASKIVPLLIEPDEWVILNKQQTGFYRVNYDEENWQLLINYLSSEQRNNIHILNRAQLLNDALAFVKEGSLRLGTLLNLTYSLTNETEYIGWYPGFKTFDWLKEKLANTEHYLFFKGYVLNTTQNFVKSVGFEESSEDSHIDKFKRILAIRWSCSLGNKTCTNYTRTKLEKWVDQTELNSISPDLKQVTLCEGLRTADFELWQKIFNKYLNAENDDEKSYIIPALSCSNDKAILQYYLNYTLDKNTKINDTFGVIRNIGENSDVGVDTVLDFIIKRFIALLLKYKDESRLTSLFNEVGAKLTTKAQLDKLKATKDVDIPTSITGNGIQAAEKNIVWLEENDKIVTDWIEEFQRKYSRSNGVSSLRACIGFILPLSFIFLIFMN